MLLRNLSRALFAALAGGLACVAAFAAGPAAADIVVNVDQGASQPLPIAIPVFAGPAVAGDIQKVIANDLQSSGLFKPLDPATFPNVDPNVNVQPVFDGWKAISAQGLLTGAVTNDADGHLRVDFRLWDVYAGEQLLGLQFTSTPENWRRIAHKVADAVYEKLTGQQGYFDTRVVFVSVSGSPARRVRRLEIMDQDGFNPSHLTDGGAEVFTPKILLQGAGDHLHGPAAVRLDDLHSQHRDRPAGGAWPLPGHGVRAPLLPRRKPRRALGGP